MSPRKRWTYHSFEAMNRLKAAALPTHGENLEPPDGMSRRDMLGLLGRASAALALGAAGCERKPRRTIVSRPVAPEYQKPGKALYYASTYTGGPHPYGMLVKAVDGRPIKIEGNPDHVLNAGTSTAQMQASTLSLYDPDRLRSPRHNGEPASWADTDAAIVKAIEDAKRVVLITRSSLGPSERALVETFLSVKPGAQHFVHETVHDAPRRNAWKRLFGSDGELVPDFAKARVIVSFDSDFLDSDGPMLANTGGFVRGRTPDEARHSSATLNRLYVFESAMTVTGSNADERRPVRPSQLAALANAVRRALEGGAAATGESAANAHIEPALLSALVEDLRRHRGEAVAVAGPHLPEAVHLAVAAINRAVGAFGTTLTWSPAPATLPVTPPGRIAEALDNGADVLVCLGVNPVYDWPGGGFERPMEKAPVRIGHGLHQDETLVRCTFALPSAHNLESWNDARPRWNVLSLCQPLLAPLFDARQEAESLLLWTQQLSPADHAIRTHEDWHDFVQSRVAAALAERSPATKWEDVLQKGIVEFQEDPAEMPPLDDAVLAEFEMEPHEAADAYEIVIRPHHGVYDGRFANNAWLQELPEPVSKLVWGSVAALAPDTAANLGINEGDRVRVSIGGKTVELPALVQTGTAPGVIVVTLGHGRTSGGLIAQEAAGANVAALLGAESPAYPHLAVTGLVERGEGREKPVRTQLEFSMHGRPIVLDGTLDEFQHDPAFIKHKRHLPEMVDLYEPQDFSKGHKWVMAIDLGACTGCGACITACQAENNIPVVGRDECANGRDMHWMRLDRYEEGDAANPTVHNMPMLCQHCDNAPCESVCPMNATVHSPEGLNEMVYNRCVGTRFCANNCPYKVRRFNYGHYQEKALRDPVQELAHNPQVTVRGVGVMEKCTFCVQRINEEKFKAQNADEPLKDGAIRTACQQACPAQAIVFGDANDPESRVANLRKSGRVFHVLEELNVKPNVSYLARVRNPAVPGIDTNGGDHHG